MKEEEKEILLKDLGGRLQYGVKMDVDGNVHTLSGIIGNHGLEFDETFAFYGWKSFNFKPYLRPMSSMTEEEKEYMDSLSDFKCTLGYAEQKIDFCLKHHLDYRGLIEKGLALEAPEGMYSKKEEVQPEVKEFKLTPEQMKEMEDSMYDEHGWRDLGRGLKIDRAGHIAGGLKLK